MRTEAHEPHVPRRRLVAAVLLRCHSRGGLAETVELRVCRLAAFRRGRSSLRSSAPGRRTPSGTRSCTGPSGPMASSWTWAAKCHTLINVSRPGGSDGPWRAFQVHFDALEAERLEEWLEAFRSQAAMEGPESPVAWQSEIGMAWP